LYSSQVIVREMKSVGELRNAYRVLVGKSERKGEDIARSWEDNVY
jgi:hypothetical protein